MVPCENYIYRRLKVIKYEFEIIIPDNGNGMEWVWWLRSKIRVKQDQVHVFRFGIFKNVNGKKSRHIFKLKFSLKITKNLQFCPLALLGNLGWLQQTSPNCAAMVSPLTSNWKKVTKSLNW